jgi:hypothetical protein
VGKQSRSKTSRSDRKLGRERRDRALGHGLPVALPPPSRRVVASDPAPFREVDSGAAPTEQRAPPRVETLSLLQHLKRIPPSLQLLGAGILVLVVIGLYRRYTEEPTWKGEVSGASTEPLAQPTVLPEQPSPGVAVSNVSSPTADASVPGAVATIPPPTATVVPSAQTGIAVVAGKRPNLVKAVTAAPSPKTPASQSGSSSQKAIGAGNATPAPAENPY